MALKYKTDRLLNTISFYDIFSQIETMNTFFLNFETPSRLLWLTQRDALPCIVTAYIVSCDQNRATPMFVSKCLLHLP